MKTRLLLFIPCFLLLGHAAWADDDPVSVPLPNLTQDVLVSYCPSEKTRVPAKSETFPVSVYTATLNVNYGDTTLTIREINSIEAAYIGQKSSPNLDTNGYLLKATVSGTYNVLQSSTYLNDKIVTSALRGTTRAITEQEFASYFALTANDYLMVLHAGTNTFVHYTGTTFPANKAYFTISRTPYGAPSIRIVEEPAVVTALDNSAEDAKATKTIRNGQLYIRREGVTYDLMGRTIR